MAEKKLDAARKSFAKALVHDPGSIEAAFCLGELEERAGNPEKALDSFGKVWKIDPHHKLVMDARHSYNRILASLFAKRIADEIKLLGERSVAVLDFTDGDGQPNYLGTLFGQELTAALSRLKEPDLILLERKRMKDLFAEKMLDESDLVDKRHSDQARKFMPVDIFVMGKVLDKTFVSVIEKDSGKMLLQDSYATFGGGGSGKVSNSWKQLEKIRNHKPGFPVKLWTNKPRGEPYYEGETVTFHFTVGKLAYAYIYALQPDGSIGQLYPNPYMEQMKLEAGKEYIFPPENASFDIPINPPHGLHRVKMVACTKNVDPYAPEPDSTNLKSIAADDDTTMRNIGIRLHSEAPTEWAETTIRFPTLPKPSNR
ncbi:MAG: DUF4384 domain-containing protein [Planctomycetota bacterium]